MRFHRNAKIFRGQLDAAPVAGVFFLLPIFFLLASLLYTPGVLIDLGNASSTISSKPVIVTRTNAVSFDGKIYKTTNELQQLRIDLKNVPAMEPIILKSEPGASQKLISEVRGMIRIELPVAENLPGTDNPTVVVAVNLRGQFFYDNQIIDEPHLKTELKNRLQEAGRNSQNLTLVLLADKAVENGILIRLEVLAREVGIKWVSIATRPGIFPARKNSVQP